MKKTLFGSVLCGAAVLSAAVVFSSCGRAQINASDYVTIKFDGYDNYGTASARFDYVQMMQDNKEAFKLDKGGEMAELNAEVQLEENIDGKLDKTTELKNGDTVTYSWNNRDIESLEKNFKVKFTFEDKTATVSGLDKAEDFDPFEDISLDFTGYDGSGIIQQASFNVDGVAIEVNVTKNGKFSNGDTVKAKVKGDIKNIKENMLKEGKNITQTEKEFTVEGLEPIKEVDLFEYISIGFSETAPNGKASVSQKAGAPVSRIDFTADKTEGLSNGDVVTVTINGDYSDEGIKPTSTTKEYTVEGLASYASKLSDIPDDTLVKMKDRNKDLFEAHVASDWGDANGAFKKMTFKGVIFQTPKPEASFGWNEYCDNWIGFVYLISTTSKEMPTYYWVVGYKNIMILEDGTVSYDASYAKKDSDSPQITLDGIKRNKYYNLYTYGYPDYDTMFNRQITASIDKYAYETTVKDPKAADKKKD